MKQTLPLLGLFSSKAAGGEKERRATSSAIDKIISQLSFPFALRPLCWDEAEMRQKKRKGRSQTSSPPSSFQIEPAANLLVLGGFGDGFANQNITSSLFSRSKESYDVGKPNVNLRKKPR